MLSRPTLDAEREIKISDLFYYVFRRFWLILGILVLSVIGVVTYSYQTYEPMYTAKASMVVNAKYNQSYGTVQGEGPTSNEIYLAQKLVNTYTLILKSDRIMESVIDALSLHISAKDLRSHISLSSVADTQVLYLSVTHPNPDLAVKIANTLIAYAPQVMMETVEIGSVNVLDSATIATPTSINLTKNTGLGGAAGLVLGIGTAVLGGFLFPRIKNSDDIRSTLTIAVLGEVRHMDIGRKAKCPLLLDPDAPHSLFEAFMLLSSGVRYTAQNRGVQTLLVTSALEGEGKTFVSLNLAMALAASHTNVLLIDCDFRKQAVRKRLGLSRDAAKNFYNVVTSSDEPDALNACIINVSPGLFVIPFVKLPIVRSSEFINSPVFSRALGALKQQYDYIIIDSPPGYFMADTMDLARLSDGVLFVIRQEHSSEKVLVETADRLINGGANVIGSVLNDIRHMHAGSGYASKYKYDSAKYSYHDKPKDAL